MHEGGCEGVVAMCMVVPANTHVYGKSVLVFRNIEEILVNDQDYLFKLVTDIRQIQNFNI